MTSTGTLTIHLSAIENNYRHFQKLAGPKCTIAGVIKADAYGLGAFQVFEKLKALSCPQFFVATLDEALSLRAHDHQTSIAVLGGLFYGAEEEYIFNNIIPVLNSPGDIQRWQKICHQEEKSLPAFIHFDTGMNRLGLGSDDALDLIHNQDRLTGIDVQLILSHFVCADEKDHPLTIEQAKKFSEIAAKFPTVKKSLANSPGLFSSQDYHYDMVRPGLALYGGNPTPYDTNPVESVISLDLSILQIRHVKKGESIGYGASHYFEKDTRTATIALGYADGFLRSASNHAYVFYKGTKCPVIGRVSMDLVTIDVGHIPNIQPGETVELLGPHQTIDDLAGYAGTIGYEILTSLGLGQRYKRCYV